MTYKRKHQTHILRGTQHRLNTVRNFVVV